MKLGTLHKGRDGFLGSNGMHKLRIIKKMALNIFIIQARNKNLITTDNNEVTRIGESNRYSLNKLSAHFARTYVYNFLITARLLINWTEANENDSTY